MPRDLIRKLHLSNVPTAAQDSHYSRRVPSRESWKGFQHGLRHSFATRLFESGAELTTIQALRHNSLGSTHVYLKLSNARIEERFRRLHPRGHKVMKRRCRRKARSWSAEEVFLQPWFLDHEHAAAVRSVVSDHFVHKMRFYFEDWGCLVCGSRKRRCGANGMCHICIIRILKRLVGCLKKCRIGAESPLRGPTTELMNEIARVRSAKMLLADIVSGNWMPIRSRLSNSVRRPRSRNSPGLVRYF
jgi:integrase-like protein